MFVTLGVSLAMTGSEVALRTAATSYPGEFGIGPVIHAAGDIGARDVEFQGGKGLEFVKPFGHQHEFVHVLARDVGDNRGAKTQ
jgi:hypothetical protein